MERIQIKHQRPAGDDEPIEELEYNIPSEAKETLRKAGDMIIRIGEAVDGEPS